MPTKIVPINKNILTRPELTDKVLILLRYPKKMYPKGASASNNASELELLFLAQFAASASEHTNKIVAPII